MFVTVPEGLISESFLHKVPFLLLELLMKFPSARLPPAGWLHLALRVSRWDTGLQIRVPGCSVCRV